MSGFVSSPAPAITPPGTVLECGPFWPDIDINHFRDSQRIGGTMIPDNRVTDALLGAIVDVETDLGVWRAALEEAGQALFAAVAAAGQQGGGDAGAGPAPGAGDDVVDAEFTEVKDDDGKAS